MAINRFGSITPVNFQFAKIPLQAAMLALQSKQKRFDIGREMAAGLDSLSAQVLPADQEMAKSKIGAWRNRIDTELQKVSGDYSRIYGELFNIRKEAAREFSAQGGIGQAMAKYKEFTTLYNQYRKDPSKYDPTLVNMWYQTYMNPKSKLKYMGVGKGGEYQTFEAVTETPNLHKLALEAIRSLPQRKIKGPGDLSIEGSNVKQSGKGVKIGGGYIETTSTTLEYRTPEEVQNAVIQSWLTDPQARTYFNQFAKYKNALDPENPMDISKTIQDMAKGYVSYAYQNKLVDFNIKSDPNMRLKMIQGLLQGNQRLLNDGSLDRLPRGASMFRKISAVDLYRVPAGNELQTGKLGIVDPRITSGLPFSAHYLKDKLKGKARIQALLKDPYELAATGLSKPLVELVDKELGPNYSASDFSKAYNEKVKELGGQSVKTMRRFDLGTSEDLTKSYFTYSYVSNATIYKQDKDGRVRQVQGKSEREDILNKFYNKEDPEKSPKAGVIGITTPASGIDPSFVVTTRGNDGVYFVAAPASLQAAYEPIVKLTQGIYNPLGESEYVVLPLNINGTSQMAQVKSKAKIIKSNGREYLDADLYIKDENGNEVPLSEMYGVSADQFSGLDLLNQLSKDIENQALPGTLGYIKNKNFDFMGNTFPGIGAAMWNGIF